MNHKLNHNSHTTTLIPHFSRTASRIVLLALLLLPHISLLAKGVSPPSPPIALPVAAKTVFVVYESVKGTTTEPATGFTTYTIKVSVADTANVLTDPKAVVEALIEVDPGSSAVENQDYKWLNKPNLVFKKGGVKEYELALKILADKNTDANELLVLRLSKGKGTAKVPSLNLNSTHTLTILDAKATSAIVVAFKAKNDTIREPIGKVRAVKTIIVNVTDIDKVLDNDGTTIEVEVEADSRSSAVENLDYKWLSKPKMVFKKGSPSEYELLLEIQPDQTTDTPETLLLTLKSTTGTVNITKQPDVSSTYTLIIQDGDELPDVPLSIALGTNLNVLDKETTGTNIYFDVMAFQLRATTRGKNKRDKNRFNYGGYVRGYQQQGTSGFNEVGLGRTAGADRLRAVYTQISALGNNTLRVDRAYTLFTPKDPTVRSSGAVLSLGVNAINSVSATHRLQLNINAHLEWVKREIRVEYDEQTISRDTIEVSTQQFNFAYLGLPRRNYSSIDQYVGLDFPILYQCKIGEQNLGFKIVPSVGALLIRSDFSPTSTNFYFNTYVSITEYKHGFTLGFDTKNILFSGESQNLGFSLFAVKMFNLSTIGELFGFAESK